MIITRSSGKKLRPRAWSFLKAPSSGLKKAIQSIVDIITFKSIREIFELSFTFELNDEDLKAIEKELWS